MDEKSFSSITSKHDEIRAIVNEQIQCFVKAFNLRITTLEDIVIKMYDEVEKRFNNKISDWVITLDAYHEKYSQIIDHFGKGKLILIF